MIVPDEDLVDFLLRDETMVLVETESVAGSGPREPGSYMVVSEAAFAGTVGGGALEHAAIKAARDLLAGPAETAKLPVTLGPDTGQCCGGNVVLSLCRLDAGAIRKLRARVRAERGSRQHVFIFGAGHVGHALADALARLPFAVHLADSRPDALAGCPKQIETHLLAMPEALVRDAPTNSAFVVMTHDHGQDFLIASEALRRSDTAYVGLIGSKTKRERFRREFFANGGNEAAFARLVSPIGDSSIRDKRPAIIAALAAAEITEALLSIDKEVSQKHGEVA